MELSPLPTLPTSFSGRLKGPKITPFLPSHSFIALKNLHFLNLHFPFQFHRNRWIALQGFLQKLAFPRFVSSWEVPPGVQPLG